jgi:hypothetical protein
MKAEAAYSSKMLSTTYQTTRHKLEDSNINNTEVDLRECVPEISDWMS